MPNRLFGSFAGAAGIVIGVAMSLSAAFAADVVRPIAPPIVPAPVVTWTGCYVGIHGGWGWGRKEFADIGLIELFAPTGETYKLNVNGGLAGGQVGCDKQFHNNFVFGVQGSGSWTNIRGSADDTFTTNFGTHSGTVEAQVRWLASITARLGHAAGNHLWYVKGGAAFIDEHDRTFGTTTCTGRCIGTGAFDLSGDAIHAGWTIGAGMEWLLHSSWSLTLEYNYYDFGTRRVGFSGSGVLGGFAVPGDVTPKLNTVTVGLNHRF